ncbi:Thymidine phosphorylase [Hartmannibacter diazotrophicus]|uniref:Thymidine phosphorylase n=1 Tax=Hartmannibacter diazotrophicus TaxID=1482074 RepID=A0A2C9D1V6_9HYPH|nr:thymidine phosphorylase [Hartmannibacter diazotrophicus]SON54203.1 Thymidine phosphorylase [Hartmannibacter diazotrophicus]
MLPQEIIRRKRDGETLGAAEIAFLVGGLIQGTVSREQIAAFAMAVFFRGMSRDERVALTLAMRDSGTVLDWSDLPGPALDKHSSGGIGDTVSLMLAPAVAACGGFVPMISGRGLGHTGGTLDKLDAIPGYASQPDSKTFRKVVREVGCAIIGQTEDLAPADKRIYAIRDVTGTVESIDLITASILSKKLAAGLTGLVLDVKCGSGAFMAGMDDARGLAESLVSVAVGAGLPTTALITDMNEPLGSSAGNALEVRLAIDFLTRPESHPRLREVTVELGAEMLVLGQLQPDLAAARDAIGVAFSSGRAAEIFARMVAGLGGPSDLMERPDLHLASAPVTKPAFPERPGIVQAIATREIGVAVVAMKGGRTNPDDAIDPSVGFSELAGLGASVGPDRPLGLVHAATEADAERAVLALRQAYMTKEDASVERSAILEKIGG